MQKHAWGIRLKLSRHLLPEYSSPKAATCFQPDVLCPVRQLHHVFTPGSPQAQQPWRICLPLSKMRSTETPRSAIVMAAAASAASKALSGQAATVNASNVKAAFAAAGLSQDAVNHIVRQYPPYLGWNVEEKLLPAIQSWQQELGASFLSQVKRVPTLLHMKPAEEVLKNQYMASIGITSPERLRNRNYRVFSRPLATMQSKVAFLEQWGFTTKQILSLVEKHPDVLQCKSEHIAELLRVIVDMFGCADREALCDVMLSCNHMGLCSRSAKDMHRNFTNFCACVLVNHKQTRLAWKYGAFVSSSAELDARLRSIAEQLNATMDEAKAVVRSTPQITALLPATVGLHVT